MKRLATYSYDAMCCCRMQNYSRAFSVAGAFDCFSMRLNSVDCRCL